MNAVILPIGRPAWGFVSAVLVLLSAVCCASTPPEEGSGVRLPLQDRTRMHAAKRACEASADACEAKVYGGLMARSDAGAMLPRVAAECGASVSAWVGTLERWSATGRPDPISLNELIARDRWTECLGRILPTSTSTTLARDLKSCHAVAESCDARVQETITATVPHVLRDSIGKRGTVTVHDRNPWDETHKTCGCYISWQKSVGDAFHVALVFSECDLGVYDLSFSPHEALMFEEPDGVVRLEEEEGYTGRLGGCDTGGVVYDKRQTLWVGRGFLRIQETYACRRWFGETYVMDATCRFSAGTRSPDDGFGRLRATPASQSAPTPRFAR